MDVQTVAQTIQLIIAPVVMVTACSILFGGLNARYSVINDRLRSMARERLDLLRAAGGSSLSVGANADDYTVERIGQIDRQVPSLLDRHRLIRNALLAIVYATATFVATMLVTAIAVASRSTLVAVVVLLTFVLGLVLLLVGLGLAAVEIRQSHVSVDYEATRVMSLGR
jgi:hypothetical protein